MTGEIPQEIVEKAAKRLRQTDSSCRLISESELDALRILEAAGVPEMLAALRASRDALKRIELIARPFDEKVIATMCSQLDRIHEIADDAYRALRDFEQGQPGKASE